MTITDILGAVGARRGGTRPKDDRYRDAYDLNGDGYISLIDVGRYLIQHPAPSLLDQLIADRGAHAAPHEITLHKPHPDDYSWGRHAQEGDWSKQPGTYTGSLTLWIVAEPDNAAVGVFYNARLAVRRCRLRWLDGDTWQRWEGRPGLSWMVSSNYETNAGYQDVPHGLDVDAAFTFELPATKALHLAQSSPGVIVPTAARAVACVVEARLIGPDAARANWGMNTGADWKAADGSAPAIAPAAGLGRFLRLGPEYRTFTMLSTALTDSQVRANPPIFD